MKAFRVNKAGDIDALNLETMPIPEPKAGEILVKQKAIGLNFIDIYLREGRRIPIPVPFTPGMEGAGVVEAVGEGVTHVKIGDRIAYAGNLGSYAEYNIIKASLAIPLPDHFTFEMGAAFALQGITAHYLLHEYYPVKTGSKVLVHAAAGGMGLLLVQWLKHLGAYVIGTVSTEEKAQIAKKAGADAVIIYTQKDFVEEVKKLTDGKGVDYIIDGVGKDTFTKDLEAIRVRGWICLYGQASGPSLPLEPNSLQSKSITVTGGNLMNHLQDQKEILERANAVIKAIDEGWLKLTIDHIFPFEKAPQAQQALEDRKTTGKILLTL